MRAPVPVAAAACTAGLAAALAGCGGGSAPAAAPAPVHTVSASPCPSAPGAAAHWPHQLPADLPRPPAATVQGTTSTGAVTIVRFTTATSLRDAVLFVVDKYPHAGYLLGRGDAEANEADAPFVHGDLRGVTRMSQVAPCLTQWLVAFAHVGSGGSGGGSPLLPPHSPSGSPSPLPFG